MKTRGEDVVSAETGGKAQAKADLFDLLRRDHDRIRDHFKLIGKSGSSQVADRKGFFVSLEQELLAHLEAEERFLYTALEQHEALRPRVLESFEEHQVAKLIIGAFTSLAVDDARWPAKLAVLRKLIERHMAEEEQGLFAMGKELLQGEQLQGLTAKVQELKRDPTNPDLPLDSG